MARSPEFVIVSEAIQAVRQGLNGKSDTIVRLIESGAWREYEMPTPLRPKIRADSFVQFVTKSFEDGGLGTDVDTLKKLCRHNRHALDLIQRETQRAGGRPKKPQETGNNVPSYRRPEGNSPSKAIRRLEKDRPDLLQRVLAGELSPHGAAIEAGHRPRTISVRVHDPERLVAALRRHLDPATLADVRDLLNKET